MLLGAHLAGVAFSNAPVAGVHALAYPLGGLHHLPHGRSNALMLRPVLQHNSDAYGHVNNTIYYAWFDSTVNQWLVEAGLLDIVNGDPIGLVAETGPNPRPKATSPTSWSIATAAARSRCPSRGAHSSPR